MAVWSDAKTQLVAGAIACRSFGDPDRARAYWQGAHRGFDALMAAADLRRTLTRAQCADEGAADFSAMYFWHLQGCLLMAGDRPRWCGVRALHDEPFVSMRSAGARALDPLAAESRIQFAAWEGDAALVEDLAGTLDAHYARFRLSPVYTRLWRALAARDAASLDAALPEAEAAYRKSGRRRKPDAWGGDKSYNAAMFDVYTTAALKLARDVGMRWTYRSDASSEIWPERVIGDGLT